MPAYPGAIPTIPGDGSWTHDQVGDEIEAIAGTLGINPQGAATTLAERVNRNEFMNMPGTISGYYTHSATAINTQAITLGRVYVTMCSVSQAFSCSAVAWNVTTGAAGCTFKPVIYTSTANGLPGSLLAQGTAVDSATAGLIVHTLASAVTVPSGLVWVGGVAESTGSSSTFRVTSATVPGTPGFFASGPDASTSYHTGYSYTGPVLSTFPASISGSAISTTNAISDRFIPLVWMRAA